MEQSDCRDDLLGLPLEKPQFEVARVGAFFTCMAGFPNFNLIDLINQLQSTTQLYKKFASTYLGSIGKKKAHN